MSKHGTFLVEHGTFLSKHGIFSLEHGIFSVEHGIFSVEHGTFSSKHGTFSEIIPYFFFHLEIVPCVIPYFCAKYSIVAPFSYSFRTA